MLLYRTADVLFLLLHTGWIAFILAGWASPRTRPCHLVICLLTALSWSVLGIFYGWGYCPFTEWHWRVRTHLGDTDLPHSYLTFLILGITGITVEGLAVDMLALGPLLAAFALGCALWRRDGQRRRAASAIRQ